jgi:hypothetical protein
VHSFTAKVSRQNRERDERHTDVEAESCERKLLVQFPQSTPSLARRNRAALWLASDTTPFTISNN